MSIPFVIDNQQHRMAGPTDDKVKGLEKRLEDIL